MSVWGLLGLCYSLFVTNPLLSLNRHGIQIFRALTGQQGKHMLRVSGAGLCQGRKHDRHIANAPQMMKTDWAKASR